MRLARDKSAVKFAAACVAALLCAATVGAEQSPAPSRRAAPSGHWKLIVHPGNALRSITREELERIYRRRSRFWPDHSAIVPLNLSASDPLRRSFSAEILHSDEDELATYWNREYFQGIAPPTVLQSGAAVRAYVAATPGAIGYVAAEAVDSSVAVVEVTNGH